MEINEFKSVFDYLKRPIGKEEGLKIYKKADELGIKTKYKHVTNSKYDGKVRMYPVIFLELYFSKYHPESEDKMPY